MPKSKHQLIYQDLKQKIENNEYKFAQLLPPENSLIKTYNCARNTIRRALADLAQLGYIHPIHGKGVRVIYQPAKRAKFLIGGIETFEETAKRNEIEIKTEVVEFKRVVITKEIHEQTNLPINADAFFIKRVRYLDGKPLILDTSYYLSELVPGLNKKIAEKSIYHYIENDLDMEISLTKRVLTAEKANEEDLNLLDLDGFNCVITVTNEVFNSYGLLFEWTQSRHNPNYIQFETIAKRS